MSNWMNTLPLFCEYLFVWFYHYWCSTLMGKDFACIHFIVGFDFFQFNHYWSSTLIKAEWGRILHVLYPLMLWTKKCNKENLFCDKPKIILFLPTFILLLLIQNSTQGNFFFDTLFSQARKFFLYKVGKHKRWWCKVYNAFHGNTLGSIIDIIQAVMTTQWCVGWLKFSIYSYTNIGKSKHKISKLYRILI